jgi:hypothetical protein
MKVVMPSPRRTNFRGYPRLERALQFTQERPWRNLLSEVGRKWIAEEAPEIALLSALAAEAPPEAFIAAVKLTKIARHPL